MIMIVQIFNNALINGNDTSSTSFVVFDADPTGLGTPTPTPFTEPVSTNLYDRVPTTRYGENWIGTL